MRCRIACGTLLVGEKGSLAGTLGGGRGSRGPSPVWYGYYHSHRGHHVTGTGRKEERAAEQHSLQAPGEAARVGGEEEKKRELEQRRRRRRGRRLSLVVNPEGHPRNTQQAQQAQQEESVVGFYHARRASELRFLVPQCLGVMLFGVGQG